jgi:twitching motility protein PilJ
LHYADSARLHNSPGVTAMKAKSGNFLSFIGSNRNILVLFVFVFVTILALVATWVIESKAIDENSQRLRHISELRVLSQTIAKNASEASTGAGMGEAFGELQDARNNFETTWALLSDLNEGSFSDGMGGDSIEVARTKEIWHSVRLYTDIILESQDIILSLQNASTDMRDRIPFIQSGYENVVEILIDAGFSADQVAKAQRQPWIAERIIGQLSSALAGSNDLLVNDSIKLESDDFGLYLKAQLEGSRDLGVTRITNPQAVNILNKIVDEYEFIAGYVEEVQDAAIELTQVRDASNGVFNLSAKLLITINKLQQSVAISGGTVISKWNMTIIAEALLLVILILSMVITIFRQTRSDLAGQEETNEANQKAILRLLDELGDLADGDLTVEATVSEDFTGAIADSINFAIDQMRSLVQGINDTAVQVSGAADQTRATAMHLADASENQAQEIAGASAAINEMAVSIDQVSANASESTSVAKQAVEISKKGADVVQNTIHGMDTIREQIQDTSKRIKRLGESSQEIGDIVSLINDIADQTNILALNAAIQASMAGDAGRGFAVVADEVQRLAERASAATKQIEALVKNIQTDTNEAVASMEDTTSEVVTGARLAQNAGVALEEIETTSSNLEELIQNISNAAQQQASSAGHISNTMNVIQEITSQTSSGTTATAKSIGNLAKMAQDMRDSVAGFKLPDNNEDDL